VIQDNSRTARAIFYLLICSLLYSIDVVISRRETCKTISKMLEMVDIIFDIHKGGNSGGCHVLAARERLQIILIVLYELIKRELLIRGAFKKFID